jgi:hypothetical protein
LASKFCYLNQKKTKLKNYLFLYFQNKKLNSFHILPAMSSNKNANNGLKLYMREFKHSMPVTSNVENCLRSVTKDLLHHVQKETPHNKKPNFIMKSKYPYTRRIKEMTRIIHPNGKDDPKLVELLKNLKKKVTEIQENENETIFINESMLTNVIDGIRMMEESPSLNSQLHCTKRK